MKKIVKYCFVVFLLVGSLYAQDKKQHSGQVMDTMNSGGYTYMQINENNNVYWIAVRQTQVNKGQTYTFNEQTWMTNFKSTSLNKTFDRILFASPVSPKANLTWGEVLQPKAKSVEAISTKTNIVSTSTKTTSNAQAKAGTVSMIISKKAVLKDKNVLVKGEVVKVSRGIMGSSWVHVLDDNGDKLIFRAIKEDVAVGDKVEATGTLNVDVDYGYGYTYETIVVNSTFKKQ